MPPPYEGLEEEVLADLVAAGDLHAWAEVERLFGARFGVWGSKAAGDIARRHGEGELRAWVSLKAREKACGRKAAGRYEGWLRSVVWSACQEFWNARERELRARTGTVEDDPPPEPPAPPADPDIEARDARLGALSACEHLTKAHYLAPRQLAIRHHWYAFVAGHSHESQGVALKRPTPSEVQESLPTVDTGGYFELLGAAERTRRRATNRAIYDALRPAFAARAKSKLTPKDEEQRVSAAVMRVGERLRACLLANHTEIFPLATQAGCAEEAL